MAPHALLSHPARGLAKQTWLVDLEVHGSQQGGSTPDTLVAAPFRSPRAWLVAQSIDFLAPDGTSA